MNIDIHNIKAQSKKGFTETWVKTSKELPTNTEIEIKGKGKQHLVCETIQVFREVLLEAGFNEVINKTIIPEEEVFLQYGPEANIILDRAFYLAKISRVELGLGKERIEKITELIGEFDIEKLQDIFRKYKKGEIEADDLIETISVELGKSQDKITNLFSTGISSELINPEPQPTKFTLRSHMTGAWFSTLKKVQNKYEPPIALYSIGPRYRNEQREDAGHLRVHNSASIVIMDPKISLEAGETITKQILEKIGFKDVQFRKKEATSTYYAYEQEKEVFAMHNNQWWEIGDIGMYSPIALSFYDIKYPTFNAGFGIERISAIVNKYDDIRKLVYDYLYDEPKIEDNSIKAKINFINIPETDLGRSLAEKIENVAVKHKDEVGPCSYLIYNNEALEVYIIEREEGKKLIGPAALNEINVKEGNINSSMEKTRDSIGVTYLRGIAHRAAKHIENFLSSEEKEMYYQVKNVRTLPDINLQIDDDLENYLTGKHKKFDVRGPVFVTIYAKKIKMEKEENDD